MSKYVDVVEEVSNLETFLVTFYKYKIDIKKIKFIKS